MGLRVAVPGSDVACCDVLPVALEYVVCHVFHQVAKAFLVERRFCYLSKSPLAFIVLYNHAVQCGAVGLILCEGDGKGELVSVNWV